MATVPISLSKCSEELGKQSKQRYTKMIAFDLNKKKTYLLEKEYRESNPVVIPNVEWSDLYLYMISTPSQHTREEIRVSAVAYMLKSIGYFCIFRK